MYTDSNNLSSISLEHSAKIFKLSGFPGTSQPSQRSLIKEWGGCASLNEVR